MILVYHPAGRTKVRRKGRIEGRGFARQVEFDLRNVQDIQQFPIALEGTTYSLRFFGPFFSCARRSLNQSWVCLRTGFPNFDD